MGIWKTIFFPAPDNRNSPYEYIEGLSPSEQAKIIHRLEVLESLDLADWPHKWIHKLDNDIFQLTCRAHRLMYCLDVNLIVVLHACKKVKQKTHVRDLNRARSNYELYRQLGGRSK